MGVSGAEMWLFEDNARRCPRMIYPRVDNRDGLFIDRINFTVFRVAHPMF